MSISRRVPPPCWTEEETLALVNAYKDKWFSLGRSNLRAADWDVISAAVSAYSGGLKSAVQCRHKIEKLRKRYRAEKQRCHRRPGKSPASWNLFPLLDAMGFASTTAFGSYGSDMEEDGDKKNGNFNPSGLSKSKKNVSGDQYMDSNVEYGGDFIAGFGFKSASTRSRVRVSHDGVGLKRKLHEGFGSEVDFERKSGVNEIGIRNYGKNDNQYDSGSGFDYGVGGFPVKALGDRILRSKRQHSDISFSPSCDYEDDGTYNNRTKRRGGLNSKLLSDFDSVPREFGAKKYGSSNPYNNTGYRVNGGLGSSSRSGNKTSCREDKGRDSLSEMAMSLRMFSENFVKMEMRKMEMMKEIERSRMEMELTHTQMMLESQQQIVDSIAEAFIERNEKVSKQIVNSSAFSGSDDES